jgi:hypothetical protein
MRPAKLPLRANRWFTAALVFAGVLAGAHFSDALRPESANAQPQQDQFKSPFNSAEDRKLLIDQLKEVNQRMGRLEAQLKSGISVKVTEMPAQKDSKP